MGDRVLKNEECTHSHAIKGPAYSVHAMTMPNQI